MESPLHLPFWTEKIHSAAPLTRIFSGNDPLLNILSRCFTALILLKGTTINAVLPLKTGCLRVRNFCSHSTSRKITLRNQNKRKRSYRNVEGGTRKASRRVFFPLQRIKYRFICPTFCMDSNLPVRHRTYVVLLTANKLGFSSYATSCTCIHNYFF